MAALNAQAGDYERALDEAAAALDAQAADHEAEVDALSARADAMAAAEAARAAELGVTLEEQHAVASDVETRLREALGARNALLAALARRLTELTGGLSSGRQSSAYSGGDDEDFDDDGLLFSSAAERRRSRGDGTRLSMSQVAPHSPRSPSRAEREVADLLSVETAAVVLDVELVLNARLRALQRLQSSFREQAEAMAERWEHDQTALLARLESKNSALDTIERNFVSVREHVSQV